KSLRKGKFKPSRAAAAKTVRAKGKHVKGKRWGRDPLDSFVDAAAHALDLKLEPAWKSAVKTNLEVTLALAALFADFPLPDDAEPAPTSSAWGRPRWTPPGRMRARLPPPFATAAPARPRSCARRWRGSRNMIASSTPSPPSPRSARSPRLRRSTP